MTTGAPDWQGLRWKTEVVPRPNLMFPSGKVYFFEDFSNPPFRGAKTGDAGYSVELNTDESTRGGASLKIITDNDADDSIAVNFSFGRPTTEKIGSEMRFSIDSTNVKHVILGLYANTGTEQIYTRVKYIVADSKWQYLKSTGGYVDMPGGSQALGTQARRFSTAKIIVDTAKQEYVAFKCNELSVDLRGISTQVFAPATNSFAAVDFHVETRVVGFATAYLDYVAVTEE